MCHWALRCTRHLMWGDFVLKQSNVNPDAFESRDINPTSRLPISWAVGPETMRESEMTGERATVLFCITYSADWAWWLSLHFTQTLNSHTWPFGCNIWTSLSHSLCFGKVLFLFKRLLKTSKRYAAQDIETQYIDLVIKRIPGSFQYSLSLHSISRFFK